VEVHGRVTNLNRTALLRATALAVALAGTACLYLLFITVYPLGLAHNDLVSYWFASVRTTARSPEGVEIQHELNDAGAAHSGLHFVWILGRRHAWTPRRILASGWSEPRTAAQALTWPDAHT
jgi:hypothetical protein